MRIIYMVAVVVALVGCGDDGSQGPQTWRDDPALVECMESDYEYSQSWPHAEDVSLDEHVADYCELEECTDETDCVRSFCNPSRGVCQRAEASSNTLNP